MMVGLRRKKRTTGISWLTLSRLNFTGWTILHHFPDQGIAYRGTVVHSWVSARVRQLLLLECTGIACVATPTLPDAPDGHDWVPCEGQPTFIIWPEQATFHSTSDETIFIKQPNPITLIPPTPV